MPCTVLMVTMSLSVFRRRCDSRGTTYSDPFEGDDDGLRRSVSVRRQHEINRLRSAPALIQERRCAHRHVADEAFSAGIGKPATPPVLTSALLPILGTSPPLSSLAPMQ